MKATTFVSATGHGLTRKRASDRDSCLTSEHSKRSRSTSSGLAPRAPAAVPALALPPDFSALLSRMVRLQPQCSQVPFRESAMLARHLVSAGCRPESALWIAIKFVSTTEYTPDAGLWAATVRMDKERLIEQEREDLKKLDWRVGAYARMCDLIG